MLTRCGTKKLIRILIAFCGVAVVIGYSIFATHDFILGPSITIIEPANGSTFSTPDIRIKGVVRRIKDISLNNRSITIDDKGNFSEAILLSPGYNVILLTARDKFGRSKDYRLELVYAVN